MQSKKRAWGLSREENKADVAPVVCRGLMLVANGSLPLHAEP